MPVKTNTQCDFIRSKNARKPGKSRDKKGVTLLQPSSSNLPSVPEIVPTFFSLLPVGSPDYGIYSGGKLIGVKNE